MPKANLDTIKTPEHFCSSTDHIRTDINIAGFSLSPFQFNFRHGLHFSAALYRYRNPASRGRKAVKADGLSELLRKISLSAGQQPSSSAQVLFTVRSRRKRAVLTQSRPIQNPVSIGSVLKRGKNRFAADPAHSIIPKEPARRIVRLKGGTLDPNSGLLAARSVQLQNRVQRFPVKFALSGSTCPQPSGWISTPIVLGSSGK